MLDWNLTSSRLDRFHGWLTTDGCLMAGLLAGWLDGCIPGQRSRIYSSLQLPTQHTKNDQQQIPTPTRVYSTSDAQ